MNSIWKFIADILKAVNGPWSLIAFIALCIVWVLLYSKKISKGFLEKIIKYFFGLIILLFIIALVFNFLKNKKPDGDIDDSTFILNEEYDSNVNNWDLGNRKRLIAEEENGLLSISSNSNAWYPLTIPIEKLISEGENIEISCKYRVSELSQGGFGGLEWSMDNGQKNRLSLCLNNRKEWFLGITSVGEVILPYLKWQSNFNIKNNNFNTIVITYSSGKVKVFINEAFITDLSPLSFQGNRIGFSLNNAKLQIDYLRIKKIL